jgi:ATP-dependent protease ClpP protease subunit
MSTVYIYDEIGPPSYGLIGSQTIADELAELQHEEPIHVRINSMGGSVDEALGIRSLFIDWAGSLRFTIDAMCASAATLLAPTGAPVSMAAHGRFMVHMPYSILAGNAADFRQAADRLDGYAETILDIYEARVDGKKDRQELHDLMAVETLMTAQTALAAGFVNHVEEEAPAVAACWRSGVFSSATDEAVKRILATNQRRPDERVAKARKRTRGPTAADREFLKRQGSKDFWTIQPGS